jgi:hypothetical protein
VRRLRVPGLKWLKSHDGGVSYSFRGRQSWQRPAMIGNDENTVALPLPPPVRFTRRKCDGLQSNTLRSVPNCSSNSLAIAKDEHSLRNDSYARAAAVYNRSRYNIIIGLEIAKEISSNTDNVIAI